MYEVFIVHDLKRDPTCFCVAFLYYMSSQVFGMEGLARREWNVIRRGPILYPFEIMPELWLQYMVIGMI